MIIVFGSQFECIFFKRIEYLKTQLEAFAPLDSEEIQRIKESDLEEYSKCTEETKLLEKERHVSLKIVKILLIQ